MFVQQNFILGHSVEAQNYFFFLLALILNVGKGECKCHSFNLILYWKIIFFSNSHEYSYFGEVAESKERLEKEKNFKM